MSSKFSLLTKFVEGEVNTLVDKLNKGTNDITSSSEKTPNSNEKERDKDVARAEKERRKRSEADQYKREKIREDIRKKYGLQKASAPSHPQSSDSTNQSSQCCSNSNIAEEVKDEFDMTEEEYNEFRRKLTKSEQEKMERDAKFKLQLERRQNRKEMKKTVRDSCKTQ